jgi:hypothetical protein
MTGDLELLVGFASGLGSPQITTSQSEIVGGKRIVAQ